MFFKEVEPNENFDLRRFESLPTGRWQAGIIKMLWGKARVRLALAESDGWCTLDYWGDKHETAFLMLGFIVGVCMSLPESIEQDALEVLFPIQHNKELGPDFWDRLFKCSDRAREIYGDYEQ